MTKAILEPTRLIDKVSIIILSFDRHNYMLRAMRYWSSHNVEAYFIDGSIEKLSSEYLLEFNDKTKYYHLPVPYNERLLYAASLSTTEYTIMIADDEFLIPSAIEKCINELDNDKSLISCFGAAVTFKNGNNEMLSTIAYPKLINYSLTHNSQKDRMIYHMGNYVPSTIYSIMRTSIWNDSMKCVGAGNVSDEYQIQGSEELIFELVSSYYGKSRFVPVLS